MKVSINALGVISLTPDSSAEAFCLATIRDQGKIKISFCTKEYDASEYILYKKDMKTLEEQAEDFNDKMWSEYSLSMEIYQQEETRWNTRILKAIANQLGEKFLQDVVECFEENEVQGKLELIKTPKGEWQEEEYTSFNGIWVDQWSVGDSGDNWNGYICIKLKENLWLKTFYSM